MKLKPGQIFVTCWLILGCASLGASSSHAQIWQSAIVYEGADGLLTYLADDEGNRVPDFSHAGYRGGGIPIPEVATINTITPIEGDNSAYIQAAILELELRAPDANGFRGALLLEAGVYRVSSMIRVSKSGIIMRGVGDKADSTANTIIRRVGTSIDPVIQFGSSASNGALWAELPGTRTNITTDVVQVGSREFKVENPEMVAVGDEMIIYHPASLAWLDAIDGGGTADDPPWEENDQPIVYARIVESVNDSTVTIDAPVFNHLDRSLSQSYLYQRDRSEFIEEVGLENLRVEIETAGVTSEDHAEHAVQYSAVKNGWVDGVTTLHFVHAGFRMRHSIHITVQNSRALEPHSQIDGGRRYNFEVYYSQLVLFQNCEATEARHAFVGNGTSWDSGNVFLRTVSRGAHTSSEGHRRWGQGFLFDNHTELDSPLKSRRIHLGNRGDFGTGHGWASVHSVSWNSRLNRATAIIEKPPTAQNYSFGGEGTFSGAAGPFRAPAGYIEGANQDGLYPESLYEKQLADRLGLPYRVSTESAGVATGITLGQSFPNPTAGSVTIPFSLERPAHIELEIFDVLGRSVVEPVRGQRSGGNHSIRIVTDSLPPGLFIYQLEVVMASGVSHLAGKMTIMR